MENATQIRLAIATAIDVGQQSAAATRQLAMRNTDPADSGTPWVRWFIGAATAVRGPVPTRYQVERACALLEEFVSALEDLNPILRRAKAAIEIDQNWTELLWESHSNAPTVHNEVNEVLATLGRYRVATILNRPLA